MNLTIQQYNQAQGTSDKAICDSLAVLIDEGLHNPESKIWHAHPVWFLDGNPIVGYSKQKTGIKLMFWSGASFDEERLQPGTGKFKDASITYTVADQIDTEELKGWLAKATKIQWDYKNIVKRKGVLEKLTGF